MKGLNLWPRSLFPFLSLSPPLFFKFLKTYFTNTSVRSDFPSPRRGVPERKFIIGQNESTLNIRNLQLLSFHCHDYKVQRAIQNTSSLVMLT